jgi:uncharacterized protein (DUF488 family)
MNCNAPGTIHTLGHSTRPIEIFLALLEAHRIELLVDVRRWPASRRYPQFNREPLADTLAQRGVNYLWCVALGGFRKPASDSPNTAWKVAAFRGYADFMLTDEFQSTITELEKLAGSKRSAVMCAEAVPWRCHRQLIADAFLVRGWSVQHILDDGCHSHRLPPFARAEGERIYYCGLV